MYEAPFIFKINENGAGPNLLLQVCLERGWQEYGEEGSGRERWNLWWRTSGFTTSTSKSLRGWQFTNHVPRGSVICKKDNLSRYLKVMKSTYGSIYDFSPQAFILPLDYSKLVEHCSRSKLQSEDRVTKGVVWICKPVGQSQGRGISLFRNVSELTYDTNSVVQRYIMNPLLIGGYKFDLRIYVCVPCFHPLTVYIYREGLARFSTNKYTMDDITNRYAHLTNCAINKQGPGYLEMKDAVGAGCKWNLKQLRYYLNQNGIDDWLIWQRISALIVLTVASQIRVVPGSPNCFEFYGFDILIDSDLKPWLLEVNLSPALGTDCDIDPAVKKPMLHDLFDLLRLPVCGTGLFKSLSDSSRPPDDSSDEEQAPPPPRASAQAAAHVVAIACRWRSHLTTQSVRKRNFKMRPYTSPSTKKQAPRETRLNLRNRFSQRLSYPQPQMENSWIKEKSVTEEELRISAKKTTDRGREARGGWKWENGLDWKSGPAECGDWVRAYPLRQGGVEEGRHCRVLPQEGRGFRDQETREIVHNLSRMMKITKDTHLSASFSDEKKDLLLTQENHCTDAVWHPALGFNENHKREKNNT